VTVIQNNTLPQSTVKVETVCSFRKVGTSHITVL
jgi:hypothetical protein